MANCMEMENVRDVGIGCRQCINVYLKNEYISQTRTLKTLLLYKYILTHSSFRSLFLLLSDLVLDAEAGRAHAMFHVYF